MDLNVTEVLLGESESIHKIIPLELDELKYTFGTFPVTENSPLDLTVSKEKPGVLKVKGKGTITVTIPCARCLADVSVPLDLDFEERVRTDRQEESADITDDAEPEDAFDEDYVLEGYHLNVDELVYGEALLIWPARVLCKEDCKGLCPVCGQNLNQGECGCDRTQLDPRMAKVLDIFSQFKEV